MARAVGRRQSEANALLNLGAVYRGQGDLELAQAHFEQALEINPKNERAAALLEYVNSQMGDS